MTDNTQTNETAIAADQVTSEAAIAPAQPEVKAEALAEEQKDLLDLSVDPDAPKEKPADDKAAEADKGETKNDAPVFDVEKITVPDNMAIPEDVKEELAAFAKERKLTTEDAQKMVDMHLRMQEKALDQWVKMKQEWANEVKADPVLGGENLQKTIDNCNRFITDFAKKPEFGGSQELFEGVQNMLTNLGLGNNKYFLQFVTNAYNATRDGQDGGASAGNAAGSKTIAEKLWPNMQN